MNIGVTAGRTSLMAVNELTFTVKPHILEVKNVLLKSVYCVTEYTICSRVLLAYKIENNTFRIY
jgi:hypothetical protein